MSKKDMPKQNGPAESSQPTTTIVGQDNAFVDNPTPQTKPTGEATTKGVDAQEQTSIKSPPMGTSSLIGSFKTVRPKRHKMQRQRRKSQQSTSSDLAKQDAAGSNAKKPSETSGKEPSDVEMTSVHDKTMSDVDMGSNHDKTLPDPYSPSRESSLLPTHLLSSPAPSSAPFDGPETSSTPHAINTLPTSSVTPDQETSRVPTDRVTPSSQPRSIRRSSRRTGTTSSRLEKARKLFQDAEEIFSPPATVANKPKEERPLKDFELDYDSAGTEVKKETRSQMLAKQRKGQFSGNVELELGAKSPLPLHPSSLARAESKNQTPPAPADSSYSAHSRVWSAGLSAASPPFVPQSLAQTGSQSFVRPQSQHPDITESYSNKETGPIDTMSQSTRQDRSVEGLPANQNQGGYTGAMSYIGGVGRQDMKYNDLQAFSKDFGILPGSEEETKAIVSGRVRNWTMSQLGKGKPSIAPSDRFVKREPSILELVHAHIESSDGVVLTRQPVGPAQAKRRTASSGSLNYVDPQKRLRSVTLTSIPAEGESEEEKSKRSRSKDNRHGRSHTSADIRSTQQGARPERTLPDQPESITTSSDIEDHLADGSDDDSMCETVSAMSTTFGLGPRQKATSPGSGQVSDAETEQGDNEVDKGSQANPRKLTGISPAMRGDFQGRVLQFGPSEEEYQPLKTRMNSSNSSIASVAGTHGSVISPPPGPTKFTKTFKSPVAKALETRKCDTCGRATATSVLTLMEPCYHLACFDCLNAVLNTVCSNGPGGNPGRSRCSSFGCGKETVGIIPYLLASPPVRQQADKLEDKETQLRLAFDALPDENEETVVVRMDNVAWDVTPEAVVAFLPPNTLADNLIQNVHIMLDRNDGKAKDYLFFECRDRQAATQVLRSRQNAVLGHPPRARPVTLTLSTHAALITELRPSGPRELENLMALCRSIDMAPESTATENPAGLQTPQQTPRRGEASVTASPAQSGRFLKSPLAPFHSLMSLLSKIATNDEDKAGGSKTSVIYWDLFACAAGAISVLAKRTLAAHRSQLPPTPPASKLDLLAKANSSPFHQTMQSVSPTPAFHIRTESQIQRSSIEAKVREKLERDQARQAGPGPLGTPRAPGRGRADPVTPGKSYNPMEATQHRVQEEALAHLLIGAFEKTFGFRINQGGVLSSSPA